MNIFDKMTLLKLLREYNKLLSSRDVKVPGFVHCRQKQMDQVQTVQTEVEDEIRNWINSGGGF